MRQGLVNLNPFAGIKPKREERREPRVLRRGELALLEWRDLDLDAGLLRVVNKPEHPTKTGGIRQVGLTIQAVQLLLQLKSEGDGRWVFRTEIGTPWVNNLDREQEKIVKRAGIPHCTLHDLRRTANSHFEMAGVGRAIIRSMMGHSNDEEAFKHYTGIAPKVMREAAARLPYADAIHPNKTQNVILGDEAKTAQVTNLTRAVV